MKGHMKVEVIRKMKTSGDREERGHKRPGDRGSGRSVYISLSV